MKVLLLVGTVHDTFGAARRRRCHDVSLRTRRALARLEAMGIEPNVGAFALASGATRRVMKSIEWSNS